MFLNKYKFENKITFKCKEKNYEKKNIYFFWPILTTEIYQAVYLPGKFIENQSDSHCNKINWGYFILWKWLIYNAKLI